MLWVHCWRYHSLFNAGSAVAVTIIFSMLGPLLPYHSLFHAGSTIPSPICLMLALSLPSTQLPLLSYPQFVSCWVRCCRTYSLSNAGSTVVITAGCSMPGPLLSLLQAAPCRVHCCHYYRLLHAGSPVAITTGCSMPGPLLPLLQAAPCWVPCCRTNSLFHVWSSVTVVSVCLLRRPFCLQQTNSKIRYYMPF